MCLSKTASVSACVLEVGVGKPSVGQGRGLISACEMSKSKGKNRDQL